MAEIFPMNVIGGGTLVFDFLLRLGFAGGVVLVLGILGAFGGLAFCSLIFDVLSDLHAIFGCVKCANVRLVAHPGGAAASEEAILNGIAHCGAEIWVMLDLVIKRTLNDFAGNATNGIVVTEPAL